MLTLSGLARALFGHRILWGGHYYCTLVLVACQVPGFRVELLTITSIGRYVSTGIENNDAVAELILTRNPKLIECMYGRWILK